MKARADGAGFALLERWIGTHDCLFLRRDRALPLGRYISGCSCKDKTMPNHDQRQRSNRPSAVRMRRLYERRRRGYRCVSVEVGADDVAGLIQRGLLDRLQQGDPDAVRLAMHCWLDRLAQ